MNTERAGQGGSAPSFEELSPAECRSLLAEATIGRVGWTASDGVFILPVTFLVRDDTIAFRTAPYGRLAQLVTPTPVAFQVDELDIAQRLGSSVLVQGTTHGAQVSGWDDGWRLEDVQPWADGTRNVFIEIKIDTISGRAFRRRR